MDYSIAISEPVNQELQTFLLNNISSEEICFATWNSAEGKTRYNILVNEVLLPKNGDRVRHEKTVSALPSYVDRCKEHARKEQSGLAMIHTHPMWTGHQDVSIYDLYYERDILSREVFGVTGKPFVGMTLSGDGIWSGRVYPKPFEITPCCNVRTVGKNLHVDFNPKTTVIPKSNNKQLRTTSVWGENKQSVIMGLKIGIVGVGSVGSAVGEVMCRLGVSNIHLMDYDKVDIHNLDRMNSVVDSDVGLPKKDVVSSNLIKSATSSCFRCTTSANSIVEPEGFREALDCDVVFCCVDRPWPRQVLNHIAYSCLIPVIDGGVLFKTTKGRLDIGMFRAQTIGVERVCLDCLGALNTGQIERDRQGLFDSPDYISSERKDKEQTRQNIMPFVFGLAGLETIQFVELVTNLAGKGDLGQQPYDYRYGEIIPNHQQCKADCAYQQNVAQGDKAEPLLGSDKSRMRAMHGRSSAE